MSVIILLIILSIIVAIVFLAIFFWAVKSGQYDDTVSPGIRILFDEKKHPKSMDEKDKRAGDKED